MGQAPDLRVDAGLQVAGRLVEAHIAGAEGLEAILRRPGLEASHVDGLVGPDDTRTLGEHVVADPGGLGVGLEVQGLDRVCSASIAFDAVVQVDTVVGRPSHDGSDAGRGRLRVLVHEPLTVTTQRPRDGQAVIGREVGILHIVVAPRRRQAVTDQSSRAAGAIRIGVGTSGLIGADVDAIGIAVLIGIDGRRGRGRNHGRLVLENETRQIDLIAIAPIQGLLNNQLSGVAVELHRGELQRRMPLAIDPAGPDRIGLDVADVDGLRAGDADRSGVQGLHLIIEEGHGPRIHRAGHTGRRRDLILDRVEGIQAAGAEGQGGEGNGEKRGSIHGSLHSR